MSGLMLTLPLTVVFGGFALWFAQGTPRFTCTNVTLGGALVGASVIVTFLIATGAVRSFELRQWLAPFWGALPGAVGGLRALVAAARSQS